MSTQERDEAVKVPAETGLYSAGVVAGTHAGPPIGATKPLVMTQSRA
ncbi:MAG TPA: hypothetical protein VFI80_00540 [Burkholderiales bacterium]|nr:hypothetical protein [Burkholderiales bacterium]